MPKGEFIATQKTKRRKEILIKIEGSGNDITVTKEDGQDPVVNGHQTGPTPILVIDGKTIPNVFPDHTVIFTHTNPTCGYYYFNGRWWYR